MKIVSDGYKAIAESLDGSARYYHQILVDGVELTDTIVEFKYSHTCNNSTNFSVGNTASAMVELKIDEPSIDLENKEIEVNQGLKLADGSMEYVKLGKFKVLSPEIERFQGSYQCVDAMTYLMSTKYESQLTYPTTDLDVLEEVCAQTGIGLVNSGLTSHTVPKKLENYTKREIIGIIAQLQGKNAIINAHGNLEFIWYTQTDYVVDDNRIYSDRTDIIKNENDYVLGHIKSTYGSKEIVSGDINKQGIKITNPYMTQDILDEVFNKIKGLTFRAINVDFYGDFRLEVGDIVTVNTNNESYIVPVMALEQSSDGGVVTTIESIGETSTQNSVDTNGSTLNEIKRSVVNSETARSIAEQAADKISFVVEGDTASEFTVTENVIQATTEKLVIKTEKGGEVVIKDGIMYVDDIFAEEITATGTITGATLTGGTISGATITSYNTEGYNAKISNGKLIIKKIYDDGKVVQSVLDFGGLSIVDSNSDGSSNGSSSFSNGFIQMHDGSRTTYTQIGVASLTMYKSNNKILGIDSDNNTFDIGMKTTITNTLDVTGTITLAGATSSGTIYFGANKTSYIDNDGDALLKSITLPNNSYLLIKDKDGVAKTAIHLSSDNKYSIATGGMDNTVVIGGAGKTTSMAIYGNNIQIGDSTNTTGITLNSNTTVVKSSASISYLGVKNTKREGRLLASADGYIGIWDVAKNRWLCYSDNTGRFIIPNSHEIKAYGGFTAFGGTMTSTLNTQNVIPTTNSTSTSTGYTVGTSNYRYRYLYAFGSSIQTSDRNYKHSFDYEYLQRLDSFFNALKPCSYYMVGGDRKHLGFVAQDVEEAMNQNGMTIDDLSFVCKDAEYTLKDEKQPDTEENREYALDEEGNQKYIYGLKYTELHAMEVDQIQRLKTRVSDLEFALSQALARIDALESKLS